MSLTQAENELFSEWQMGRQPFVTDGIVDEDIYSASSPKILLVLKEVNSPEAGAWDLRKFLREGAQVQTWDNATRWIEGIHGQHVHERWSDFQEVTKVRRITALRKIAVINLKKEPGGHTADTQKVEEAAIATPTF